MKLTKLSLILIAAAAVVFGLSGISVAFHEGGVANCTGCHQVHNAATTTLLVAADASSVCLNQRRLARRSPQTHASKLLRRRVPAARRRSPMIPAWRSTRSKASLVFIPRGGLDRKRISGPP